MRHIHNPYLDRDSGETEAVTDVWLLDAARSVADSIRNFYKSQRDLDDWDPYTGMSGVAYAYRQASNSLGQKRADKARKLLKQALEHKSSNPVKNARFLCGRLGTLAIEISDPECSRQAIVAEIEAMSKSVAGSSFSSDELFVGRAGYLAAVTWIRNTVDPSLISDEAVLPVLKAMIASGIRYSERNNSPSPLMYDYHGTEYIGAAHGLAGIMLCALNFFDLLDEAEKRAVVGAVEWLLYIQDSTGNFASSTKYISRRREEPLIHWCHGAPGVIGVFLKMYKMTGDERHLQAAVGGGELIWREGILKKGPGLCHGVSGNGYVMLLLWRATGNHKWLHRAQLFASLMMDPEVQRQQREPNDPFSLFEGWGGGLCFLVNLLNVNRNRPIFPLYPLFL